jgi:exopolyphosphatase/guanosine-5'-triphosphate,3'-diphosphate pyrophosphatase
LRAATNGKQFLDEALERFGFSINVISGSEEATLIYHGARQALRMSDDKLLIMDIGGGSVEFIIANGKRIFWKRSFKIGAALLIGRFNPEDPLTRSDVRKIAAFLEMELKPLFIVCRGHNPALLVGTAGSFETFASMIRHRFPGSGSHYGRKEHPIVWNHFQSLYRELIVSKRSDRATMKGLIKMRVDMIVMAALMLNFVLDRTGIRLIRLSAYSLKEGAIWKLMQEN